MKNATADAERKKSMAMGELFGKYSDRYDLDSLLMAAQGYQESTLKQDVRSPVGAIGVMQVMPPTGKELNVGDIAQLQPNIHAGVKYMRRLMDKLNARCMRPHRITLPSRRVRATIHPWHSGPIHVLRCRALRLRSPGCGRRQFWSWRRPRSSPQCSSPRPLQIRLPSCA